MRNRRGFTLIEMIGVLAVITIIAGMIVPRVFKVIDEGRVKAFAADIATIKTALVDMFADCGDLPRLNGEINFQRDCLTRNNCFTPSSTSSRLWRGPYLEKTLVANLLSGAPGDGGDGVQVQYTGDRSEVVTSGSNNFDLNGNGLSDTDGFVYLVKFDNVTGSDFRLLDDLIDGVNENIYGSYDVWVNRTAKGRVKFNGSNDEFDVGELRVYLHNNPGDVSSMDVKP